MGQDDTPRFPDERMVGRDIGFTVNDVEAGCEYLSLLEGFGEGVRVDDGALYARIRFLPNRVECVEGAYPCDVDQHTVLLHPVQERAVNHPFRLFIERAQNDQDIRLVGKEVGLDPSCRDTKLPRIICVDLLLIRTDMRRGIDTPRRVFRHRRLGKGEQPLERTMRYTSEPKETNCQRRS